MASSDFNSRLADVQRRLASVLCVGLDPDPDRLPRHLLEEHPLPDAVIAFNAAVIDRTKAAACAYKLNLAFYEALGADGWRVMEATLAAIPDDRITIADGKRGDIGNSARFYARTAFEQLGFDACTVSGYMGRDSVAPFLEFEGTGVFLLVRTSNPGARDIQEITCGKEPLYLHVALAARIWDDDLPGTIGFVAGATDTEALRKVRKMCPEQPLLIPGIGAQGGDAHAVMRIAESGTGPVLINSSRSIIYSSNGLEFAEAAGEAAEALRTRLQAVGG